MTPAAVAEGSVELAISDIVLWELAKLVQLGRITLDLNSPAFQTCLQQLPVIPVSLSIARASTQLDFRCGTAPFPR